MQIKHHVHEKLAEQKANLDPNDDSVSVPDILIDGENYEVGGAKALLASVIGWVRNILFIVLFVGEATFQPFGGLQAMPKLIKDGYRWIEENKFQFGMVLFFVGSMF
jgi:hypothetical protein